MSDGGRTRSAVPVAVFASGGGSNLQSLIDHLNDGAGSAARVALVISDRPDAGALERATRAGVPTRVIAVKGREPDAVAAETVAALEEHAIGIVALAGYLKLVPVEVVRRFRGRMLNIHPALLPAFGGHGFYGARVHRAVLESGARVSGPTVHLVDEAYDTGRILAQWPVPVLDGDTPESLGARVLAVEHVLYPVCVEAVAEGDDGAPGGAATGAESGRRDAGYAWADGPPTIDAVRAALRSGPLTFPSSSE